MAIPFMGEIKIFPMNYAPRNWAQCNGQFLPINQNQALFSLLGTSYGGNGQTTFALPNLRGRVMVHAGSVFSLMGLQSGEEGHPVTVSEMAAHTHQLMANNGVALASTAGIIPDSTKALAQGLVALAGGKTAAAQLYGTGPLTSAMAASEMTNTGGSQPHENRQPYLTLNICIALQGLFPSRN